MAIPGVAASGHAASKAQNNEAIAKGLTELLKKFSKDEDFVKLSDEEKQEVLREASRSITDPFITGRKDENTKESGKTTFPINEEANKGTKLENPIINIETGPYTNPIEDDKNLKETKTTYPEGVDLPKTQTEGFPAKANLPIIMLSGREETPATTPKSFNHVRGSKAKVNVKTKEIWMKDLFHKDHYEVYKDLKNYENRKRDRSVWDNGKIKEEKIK